MVKGNFILNFDYKNNEVHYLPKNSSELEECQILFSFLKKKKGWFKNLAIFSCHPLRLGLV